MTSRHKERGEETEKHPGGSLTFHTELGSRDYQEDRFVAETAGETALQILAVMDGHGGFDVAQLAADKLVPVIQESYAEASGPQKNIESVLETAVSKLNEATRQADSGSTLSIVAIPEDESKAYVTILGDSPVIISDSNGEIHTSPEHNVRSNFSERENAVTRGAYYDGIGYIGANSSSQKLQMSRVLGDRELDGILDRTPEIYSVELGEDSFVIVATDGVLDPSHRGDLKTQSSWLADTVREGADAETIVLDTIRRGGTDNATAIVWRMDSS
jgi:serine/threonine protein phosphatase PrpC